MRRGNSQEEKELNTEILIVMAGEKGQKDGTQSIFLSKPVTNDLATMNSEERVSSESRRQVL